MTAAALPSSPTRAAPPVGRSASTPAAKLTSAVHDAVDRHDQRRRLHPPSFRSATISRYSGTRIAPYAWVKACRMVQSPSVTWRPGPVGAAADIGGGLYGRACGPGCGRRPDRRTIRRRPVGHWCIRVNTRPPRRRESCGQSSRVFLFLPPRCAAGLRLSVLAVWVVGMRSAAQPSPSTGSPQRRRPSPGCGAVAVHFPDVQVDRARDADLLASSLEKGRGERLTVPEGSDLVRIDGADHYPHLASMTIDLSDVTVPSNRKEQELKPVGKPEGSLHVGTLEFLAKPLLVEKAKLQIGMSASDGPRLDLRRDKKGRPMLTLSVCRGRAHHHGGAAQGHRRPAAPVRPRGRRQVRRGRRPDQAEARRGRQPHAPRRPQGRRAGRCRSPRGTALQGAHGRRRPAQR